MEEKLKDLEVSLDQQNLLETIRLLDAISLYIPQIKKSDIQKYQMDGYIKRALKMQKSIEILEKIAALSALIKDPRNFYDELVAYLGIREMEIATLMLIYHLSENFDFEYDDFYVKLADSLNPANANSEGTLLFVLQCIEKKCAPKEMTERLVTKLASLSLQVSSEACVRIVYCILVIMRMHPALFKLAKDLKELHILKESFETIARIVERIFLEAESPKYRPKVVFLQNFAFPPLFEQNE
ncbi:hypothetical protein ENBRE01_0954 [Enteropsectra breve]|nr:hypothetical protein ENBRE01_0954 [Enteropsectra breve]